MKEYTLSYSRVKEIFSIYLQAMDDVRFALQESKTPLKTVFDVGQVLGRCQSHLFEELKKESDKSDEIIIQNQNERRALREEKRDDEDNDDEEED